MARTQKRETPLPGQLAWRAFGTQAHEYLNAIPVTLKTAAVYQRALMVRWPQLQNVCIRFANPDYRRLAYFNVATRTVVLCGPKGQTLEALLHEFVHAIVPTEKVKTKSGKWRRMRTVHHGPAFYSASALMWKELTQ